MSWFIDRTNLVSTGAVSSCLFPAIKHQFLHAGEHWVSIVVKDPWSFTTENKSVYVGNILNFVKCTYTSH